MHKVIAETGTIRSPFFLLWGVCGWSLLALPLLYCSGPVPALEQGNGMLGNARTESLEGRSFRFSFTKPC